MNFLSLYFFVLFAVTAVLYYKVPGRFQNFVLLCANIVFYIRSMPSAGLLLGGAVLAAYICGYAAERTAHKKAALAVCMAYCFGMLFIFKYLNFLLKNVFHADPVLWLIFPIGISFYSFSLVSYVFDIYRGKQEWEKDFCRFAVFASYFPSIMSGPINRAGRLLPQLKEVRVFDDERFKAGLFRAAVGAAKKLVLSAYLAGITDKVFGNPWWYDNGFVLLGVILYSIQIYVDFTAYCDMALGVSEMLGIELMENFRAPYLSRTVKDFWKGWHISLTSWFRDYLYFPLGGNRKGTKRTYINILIVFVVSGIWHGAGLTFIIWGLLNGLYQVIGSATMPARIRIHEKLGISEDSKALALVQGLITFGLITFAWIFFRAYNMGTAVYIVKRIILICRDGLGTLPDVFIMRQFILMLPFMAFTLFEDILISKGKKLRIGSGFYTNLIVITVIVLIIMLLGNYGPGFNAQDFVYFKF